MSREVNPYDGLPLEFSPPRRAADVIAQLDTAAEREAYLGRIPAAWQPWVEHHAILAIAGRIVEEPRKAERQRQLAATPERWRAEVKIHVLRMWDARRQLAAMEVA